MNAINRIYVKKLWGTLTFDWVINDQVVVLAGGNGSGKSTILRSVAYQLRYNAVPKRYQGLFENISVGVENYGSVEANFFDFTPTNLSTNALFCDLIDAAFANGQKTIIRNEDGEVRFKLSNGFVLNFDQMSSGEQELIKLYGRAVGMKAGDLYILDEPETSLHIDWQEDLIENLLELGDGMQVIISTHSPALILNGWLSNVIQIESLFL